MVAGARPRPFPGGGALRQRCERLLARMEEGLQLLELASSVEEGGCV